jgi:hypothetical protein
MQQRSDGMGEMLLGFCTFYGDVGMCGVDGEVHGYLLVLALAAVCQRSVVGISSCMNFALFGDAAQQQQLQPATPDHACGKSIFATLLLPLI